LNDRQAHARRAREHVCARGDLDAGRRLYAADFIDHVNRLEFHGHEGIAASTTKSPRATASCRAGRSRAHTTGGA
jgi:hypothetical protein